ncbi:MAG: FtsX-like permease family protein, partial [Thermoplasmata archaeon]
MRVLSFLRYSLESVIRNKRRSLFAIMGIVLALSLIAGSFIAVDSSALGMLRAAIDRVGVDFVAYDYSYNYSVPVDDPYLAPRLDAIRSVRDVDAASALATIGGWEFSNGSFTFSPYEYWYDYMVFLPEDSDKVLDAYKIDGQLPDPGTAAISKATADEFDIEVGGSVICTCVQSSSWYDNGTWRQNYTFLNLTFVVTQIWTQEESFESDWHYYYNESDEDSVLVFDYPDPVVLNMADLAYVTNTMSSNNFTHSQGISYLIWLDREKVINLGDVPGTIDRIEFIQHRLQREGYEHGFSVYDSRLVGPLSELYPQLEGMKVLFLILSLPVVALGVYLSIVGVDLGVTERRREVGILKSRGASNKQVFSSLILESLSLGAFAGILGLALGLLVSRFLLEAATAFAYQGDGEARISDYGMTSGTIILSVLFGILLTFLSSYRPFKTVSKTDVAESLHHYSPTVTGIGYKPRTDIVLLGISMLSIVSVLIGPNWAFDQEWSWITRLIVTLLLLVGLVAFPAMPFLLSLSVIRLLTRTSRKLYAKFTWIVKPWTKELHHLVDKNIVRNPRRASNLCVIISLALAFGLFISVTMESTMAYEKEMIVYEVGADAKVWGYFGRYDGPS